VRHLRIGVGLWVLILLTTGPADAAPCTAVAECSEWVSLPQSAARVLMYRSHALGSKNVDIVRALIVVHGAGRDADNNFRSALAAAFLAGAQDDTVVISLRFASTNGAGCADKVADREATWECWGPARWTVGGGAVGEDRVTTFDVVDEVLRRLARRDSFPNLRAIVVAGHSAGGQLVSRYQMANQVHETLGVNVTYVIANPSSYAYLDAVRPSVTLLAANVSALGPGYVAALPATPPPPFAPFADAANCTTYDNWPYGLQQRVGYSARLTDDRMKQQLASRRATYMLGGLDILPLFGFDSSCAAAAQGPTRLARGLAFSRYVADRFGAKHDTLIVPSCGHNSRCMFTDNMALGVLFPKP
jgi:pimeloyl-ACP methyl ester carboxylesterase